MKHFVFFTKIQNASYKIDFIVVNDKIYFI